MHSEADDTSDAAGSQDKTMDEVSEQFEVGNEISQIQIAIDYAIIKHFSEHLYSSPNKAIEELVSNGFDALATRCYVYVPGGHVQGRVLVWDNGLSMDPEGLRAMWQIARSPKENLGEGRVMEGEGRRRAVIGKFGIGKLASYAVGHRISHLCRTVDGRYLSVSVNYRLFTDSQGSSDSEETGQAAPPTGGAKTLMGEVAASNADPTHTPIRELSQEQAEELVRQLLPTGNALGFMLGQPHWTLAVIDDLKKVDLYPGRLGWVIGNGMPLRPDFRVFVEDKEAKPRLASRATTTWSLAEPKLRDSLTAAWNESLSTLDVTRRVTGDLVFDPEPVPAQKQDPGDPAVTEPAVMFPTLGRVSATVRLFTDSLAQRGDDDETRSFGFFVMVRGRLVNPDDAKLLLNDPSFGTFYRSQYQIRADAIDADLLADRESLRRDTAMTRELAVLQRALYRAARVEVEKQDDVTSKAERPESRLPVRSRELFRDPLAALLGRSQDKSENSVNLDEPVIDRLELGEQYPLAVLDEDSGHFQVNRTHPFYRAVETQAGKGKRAEATLRAFDLFAVSERLTEGFLYGRGVADSQVQDLLEWRDQLFRSLAANYDRNPDDAVLELRASSVAGDARFELAITRLFNLMGFSASRHGESGKKDILVVAPIGPAHRVFIIEAKGSDKPVVNVTAALASAAAHRDAVDDAVHAVVVAREFAGFKNKDEPAILLECRSVGGVSVVTVETLVHLYYAMLKYAYPLESIMEVLFAIETPNAKQRRVEELDRPLEDFNFREVLDEIWLRQAGESVADEVPTRGLWQSREQGWRKRMEYPAFQDKLAALAHFSGSLVMLDTVRQTVYLKQHPERVAEHISRSMTSAAEPHALMGILPADDVAGQ